MLAAVKGAGRPRRGSDGCDGEPAPAPAREGMSLAALIVEEKPICRLAICNLVADVLGSGEVGFAGSMLEAHRFARHGRAGLLLVDLFSIDFDFEGLRRLVALSQAPAIAVDDRPNPSFAALAQMAGARGYASKNYELDKFRSVIRAVVEGGVHFPQGTSTRPRRSAPANRQLGLSPRQLDVLKCIAVGMSNQQIASSLGITLGTVKLHIHAILRLTGTRNRTEAALIAGRFLAPTIED